MAEYDAIVIGGGVVGMATAWHLVRGGVRTLLLDRADEGRASDAGAGILSSRFVPDAADPLDRLKAQALPYDAELIERLQADDAGDMGYAVTGALTVAVDEDEVAPFAALRARLPEACAADGGAHRQSRPPPHRRCSRHSARFAAAPFRTATAGSTAACRSPPSAAAPQRTADAPRRRRAPAAGGAWPRHWRRARRRGSPGRLGRPRGRRRVRGARRAVGIRIPVAWTRPNCHLHLPDAETGARPVIGAFRDDYMVSWPGGRVAAARPARPARASGRGPAWAASWRPVRSMRVAPGLQAASLAEVRVGRGSASPDGRPCWGRRQASNGS